MARNNNALAWGVFGIGVAFLLFGGDDAAASPRTPPRRPPPQPPPQPPPRPPPPTTPPPTTPPPTTPPPPTTSGQEAIIEAVADYSITADAYDGAGNAVPGRATMVLGSMGASNAVVWAAGRSADGFDVYVDAGLAEMPDAAEMVWLYKGDAPPAGFALLVGGGGMNRDPDAIFDDSKGGLQFFG